MPNVLILGGRAPVALDHARRFHHQGWQTYIADSVPCRLSGWSPAVTATISLTAASANPQAFIAELNQAIARYQIDLLMPTCEEVFYLSRYRHKLPAHVRVLVDDFDKLRQLHSKWQFLTLAQNAGANPPASKLVNSIAEAREWGQGRAVVLKPEYSRFGVHVRLLSEGIGDKEPELAAMGKWVAQELCHGRELCSYSVADQGRLLAHVVYQPLHRLGKSASYYFSPCDEPQIRQAVKKLVADLQFTGQISFDWIVGADGIPHAIECNPRAISGVHLFAMDDALPAALAGTHDVASKGHVTPSQARPAMLAAVMLTAGFVSALRQGSVRQWWADYSAAHDAMWAGRSLLPMLGGVVDMGSFALMALQKQCSMREAATRDIEWDGHPLPEP